MAKPPDVTLYGPQGEVWEAIRSRLTVALLWGRACGKSKFLLLLAWLLVAQWDGRVRKGAREQRGVRIIFLLPTLKQFKDIYAEHIESDVNGDWSFLGGKLDKTTWQVTFPGGSWIKPFPAAEHASKRALGQRCDVVLLDETDDIPASVYHSVTVPWFSEPFSLAIRVAAGTPRKGRHGLLSRLFDLGENPKQANHMASFATYRDVPELVDRQAVEDARATMPPAIFAREWEANRDAAEGLVFGDVWDERKHVRKPPEGMRFDSIVIGADAGYEDPGVFLVIGVHGHGRDATAWILEEIYETHKTEDFWVSEMRRLMGWYPRAKLYHDPSMPARIVALKRDAKARPRDVNNSIHDGIASVANLLLIRDKGLENERARLYVHPDCKKTIWEFGAYKRRQDPQDADRYLEDIIDRHNHAMDALRYVALNHFGPAPSSARRLVDADSRR